MQGVIAETAPRALGFSRGRAPEAAWTAPLGARRLFALLFLTLGLYSLFYIYKVARDVRDHADSGVTPWLFPLSVLIGLANAIAAGRLAGYAARWATPETRRASCSGVVVGGLVFVAHFLLTISGRLVGEWWWIAGLLLFTVPWLVLEHQLSAIKLSLPNASYYSKPYRFTRLQWAAIALGVSLWALIVYGLSAELARWRGQQLVAGAPYEDPLGRFSIAPAQSGWVLVAPGTVVEDAELELLGPGSSAWAAMQVTEQAGWSLDMLVSNRFAAVSELDDDVQFIEKRELVPGTNTALSFTTYRGNSAFEGAFVFYTAAFVTAERAVELIVFSSGPQRFSVGAEQLARSLVPLPPKETAVDQ